MNVVAMQLSWFELDGLDESDFHAYQHRIAGEVERRLILLLAAEMGLGKTAPVLTGVQRLIRKGKVKPPVLIVAPLLVAQQTWPDEIEKWRHIDLSYTVIRGTDAKRRMLLRERTDLHIINRELIPWLHKTLRRWPYTMLVYDEASRLKGGRKRTAKAKLKKDNTLGVGRRISEFGTLARVRPFFERVVEMSGTPAPNGLHDLWGPIYILDGGKRLHRTMSAFDMAWFDINPWTYKVTPRAGAFDDIMGRISDVMTSLKESDYLKLPPRNDVPVYVTLPPSIMQAYREFERTQWLEMHDIEAVSQGVLLNKLLQFANGSVYDEHGNDRYVHDLKISALESIMQEAAGEPVLVAYEFRFDLLALKKRWPKAVIVGEKGWLERWNRGEIPMLICHPASAAHGLNLQFGGNIGVWYGLTSSLELFQQFIKRLHRQGQKKTTFMYYILARGTKDEKAYWALGRKGATQAAIMEAVKL